jgi:hypothetical protein
MTDTVFAVQDETGTVVQLTLLPSPPPASPIQIGDTGIYAGLPDDGTSLSEAPTFQSLPFTVTQVAANGIQFSIHTTNGNMADWPAGGEITWSTGANVTTTSTVLSIDGANAYIDPTFLQSYHASRGNALPGTATLLAMQAAIVQATDYIDQKYRFTGIKLLQSFGTNVMGQNASFLEAWLTPYALSGVSYLTPAVTTQSTEWPRQGVIDYNGDTVNGIPKAIRAACAELAIRVLNGVALQPDYDPNLVGAGGVVSSITKKVGPLETVTSYDTKFGLGFFASFPIVDRMISKAGLLSSGGGRTVIR